AGAPPLLELPTDHPRPALQSWHGQHQSFELDEEISAGLRRLSREEGATLFMTLLAAFKVLLYRYSGQPDISVGTPIANRNHPQIEGLIGFFVNTLVMRTILDGDMSFRSLLKQVRETALGAYMHQDVPFEMLVDALGIERDTSHTPLFQVMFTLQAASRGAARTIELPDLVVEAVDFDPPVAMFDLTLVVTEDERTLHAGLEYNSDLWEPETIQRMIAHLKILLKGIVDDPERPILALSWLTDDEREQVVVRWNDTAREYPAGDSTMHQLFEASAARDPEATALVYLDQRLTYGELNARANRLAHYLIERGVKPETFVGLCAERSVEMVVGLLGILKAGGAYVPLDPTYPHERLAYMIQNSRLGIVVAAGALASSVLAETAAQLGPGDGLRVVRLDDEWKEIEAEGNTANPTSEVDPHNAAYVIYTSGSTGQPKGVVVEHGSVVNHNLAAAQLFRLTNQDRILQFSTINFDAAVEEMFPAWSVGAAVVLRPGGMLISGEELLHLVEKEKLSVLDLPTAYWHEWVYELGLLAQGSGLSWQGLPPSLRLMVVGGDKASSEHLAKWQELAGPNVA
ncbi:MAG TPA: AMP-binding protein, partial [Anaerolineae bacterium]|nr:AMP-binding protein [Anaerolineae bacterium]